MFLNVASKFEVIYFGGVNNGKEVFIYVGEEELKISKVTKYFFIFFNFFFSLES